MGSGDTPRSDDSHRKPPVPTKSALNKLTRQAHELLQKGDLQGAMQHFDSAADQAKSVKDTDIKISCYLNAGACLVSLGQYKKGLGYLDSASRIIKRLKLNETETFTPDAHLLEMSADVHYNIATAAQATSDFERASSSFELCITLYTKAGSKIHAAEGLSALAECYKQAGVFEKEIEHLRSAQELYNELGECSHEAMVCLDLAKAYLRIGSREECKLMLGTAKMLCLRVDDQRTQGKIYSQLGLVFSSLRSFDDAIHNFERALPLLQKGNKTQSSQQTEASLLQNIGAVYNEKGLYSEAVIYHREAAALHGRTKNHNSESKSLCNLAFAQTQLKDYQGARTSFSNALARAHLAKNNFLQFQACEGLGSVHYQMEQFGEAVSYFNQALGILDSIKEDTGVARERVMEKLSDASEALERMKERRVTREDSAHSANLNSDEEYNDDDGLVGSPGHGSGSDIEEPGGDGQRLDNDSPDHLSPALNRQLSPEFTSAITVESESQNHFDLERLPNLEKRGSLPPIDTSLSPQTTSQYSTDSTPALNSSEERKPSKKHATVAKRRKKSERLPQISESGGSQQTKRQDNHNDALLEAYVDSYRESPHHKSSSSTSSSSSESESHLSAAAGGGTGGNRDSGDELGASIFSRHATNSRKQKERVRSFSPRPPSIMEGASPISSSSSGGGNNNKPQYVGEGSLAIGPNAREHFTTETHVIENGGKKHKKRKRPLVKTEIVPKVPPQSSQQQQQGSRRGSAQEQTDSRISNNPNVSSNTQQSKVCVIL